MTAHWIFRPGPDSAHVAQLEADAAGLHISPLLARLLWQRGQTSAADMDFFLSPNLRHLASPDEWPGVPAAANLLAEKLIAGKRLAVWGDYDVDGVTSVALAKTVLAGHGIEIVHYLPDRREEGYGLNAEAIKELRAQGVEVLLTADCGISDVDPIQAARELGMTVVISDHHLPPDTLPPAHAICNPRLGDCPCPDLAGVGVTFFLMAALNNQLSPHTGRRVDMRSVLDFAALGTLADVVKLTGQNRILVKNGLLLIDTPSRPGLAALKEVSGSSPAARLTAGQVVFGLTPRINAAGRLGAAQIALDLLLCTDHNQAAHLARRLDEINQDRRAEEQRIFAAALELALKTPQRAGFVLFGEDWHPGVIGIVASRLAEHFYRPALVLCRKGETLKGSGRSIPEFDLHAGLAACSDLLLTYGGHKQAAGLSIEPRKLPFLIERFDALVRATLGDNPAPSIHIDARLPFDQALNPDLLKELDLLQPFGPGNSEPVFASPPLLLRAIRRFGQKGEHAELQLTDESCNITLRAKAWRQGGEFADSLRGTRIQIAYSPRVDRYTGPGEIELRLKGWIEGVVA